MSTKIDLSQLTELELISLRQDVNSAINNYADRKKIVAYKIKISGEDSQYYLDAEKAWKNFTDYNEGAYPFEQGTELSVVRLTEAEVKKWCQDS